ncbi:MAG: bacteriohopanetetrol glucosamine biosynthesis glycosyltransferase HpnI [Armatimonadota bacterium]
MSLISIALLILAGMGTLHYVLSTAALVRHFQKSPSPARAEGDVPKVSILKPVRGIDSEARDNFLSFPDQDYPSFEVLFGILDPDDPSADLIRDIIEGKPYALMHTGSDIEGFNNKVRILHTLFEQARGDILIITDADTRASADFIDRITVPFNDPRVGMVTCMYKGINDRGMADMLEALHMTCVFAPGVAAANAIGGIDFGLGAAIAIRRKVIEKIGGFESIVNYLADDFQLGRRAAQTGYDVVLSDYVIDITLSGEKMASVLRRELRWSVTTRISRPFGHFGLLFTFGFAYALLFAVSVGFSSVGWIVLAVVVLIRWITAYIGANICLGDNGYMKRAWLMPVRDLLSFIIWIAGYFKKSVTWRGRCLTLHKDGTIVRAR